MSTLTVSQSVLKAWRRCHMKYNYKYRQLLERKKPRLQLLRGTLIGKCLDALAAIRSGQKTHSWSSVLIPYEKQYRTLFRQEQEYYGDILGDVKKIVRRYEAHYADDGLTYLKPKDKDPFELELKVQLTGSIVFTGHMDKMPRDKAGRIWIMDHKSHRNIPGVEERFSDLQLVLYYWGAPLSGYTKPTGVLWDYIRTKLPAIPEQLKDGTLSQRKNIDTTYDTYLSEVKRLKLNPSDYPILKELKPRGESDFLVRVPLPAPNPALVKTVARDALETAKEIERIGGTSTVRSMDRTCKQCEFFELCQAEVRGLDADFIRKSQYQIQKEPRHDHREEEN